MRLNKFISQTGLCSRREADTWIEKGRVLVNGRRPQLGQQVGPEDEVKVNGRVLGARRKKHVTIAFNKPAGIVCTTDRNASDNIIDFIKHPVRVFPIGRLDKDSEGLILLTSDGDIVNEVLRAENNNEKEYIVSVDKVTTEKFLSGMAAGVRLTDLHEMTQPCRISALGDRTFRIILTQGLNRQIRRMCEMFGYEVKSLKRVRIMNIQIGSLRSGHWRDLQDWELRGLTAERAPLPATADDAAEPPPE